MGVLTCSLCFLLCRRTHQVFDMALRVHKNIQQRDMEIGRNLGNWILRWLDRMKPSAQILLPKHTEPSIDKAKRLLESTRLKPQIPSIQTPQNSEVDRHLFLSLKNLQSKLSPTASMMMIKPHKPTGTTTQYRHYSAGQYSLIKPIYARGGFDGVIRKDILHWIKQRWSRQNSSNVLSVSYIISQQLTNINYTQKETLFICFFIRVF